MKKVLIFCFSIFVLSAFSSHAPLPYKKDTAKFCSSFLHISCVTTSTQWIIQKVKFVSTVDPTGDTHEFNTNLSYNTSGDTFGFGTNTYNISIQLYDEIDAPVSSGYLVLKDYNGNVANCLAIIPGTHTYTFNNVLGACQDYYLTVSPGCS